MTEILREVPAPQCPGDLLELREWKTEYGITAGITIRNGESDDYGLGGPVPAADLIPRWFSLRKVVGGAFKQVCTGRQVHGTWIQRHRASPIDDQWVLQDGVDGHMTGEDGLLLTVTAADCVPVYLFATESGELALLHAGWRGVAGGILTKGIAALQHAGAQPGNIVVHLGPAICGECYEVGPDVAGRLGQEGFGTRRVDLRAILAQQAVGHGVQRITVSAWCTMHDPQFHSHRRDGTGAGRMVAYLGRPLSRANGRHHQRG